MHLFVLQKGVCPVCTIPLGGWLRKKTAVVDHCHVTKKLRGLLHERCNRGLGYFDEDSLRLRRAADYLDKHR